MKQTAFRLLAITFGGLILLTAGCDRHIESTDPVRSLPAAPPTPLNVVSRINDRSVTLSWEVSDSANIEKFRIYRAVGDADLFTLIDSTTDFSRTLTNLPYNQEIRLRVSAVNTDRVEGNHSAETTVIAGLLSLVIADNDLYTNQRSVQIRLLVPGTASYVELSEDSLFQSGSSAEAFSSTKTFELSRNDGSKRVFGRFDFEDGSSSGEPVYDDIILDTRALIDSVTFTTSAGAFSPGDSITFSVYAGEADGEAAVSFPGVTDYLLRDDGLGGDVAADDGVYSAYYVVPVGVTVDNGEVEGNFTDAAGNRAATAIASRELDIHPGISPDPVVLAVSLVDTLTARLTWTRNEDSDFASYRVYRSVTPGILVGSTHLTIAIITDRSTVSLEDFIPSNGNYYYRIFVFDQEGLNAASNEVVVTR